jgi:UDP-3-O-[3-hydroxymyristoyl] glucosamine N-acyltransferase
VSEGWYIYGAGIHARKVLHTLRACGTNVAGMVYAGDTAPNVAYAGCPLWRADAFAERTEVGSLVVAIGDPAVRRRIVDEFTARGWMLPCVVHPSAWIAPDASLGRAVFVGAGAVIETLARIDDGCIVDIGALVDHEAHVGAYQHVRPGEVCPARSVR